MDVPQPEELAVHWLGGYWKLPKRDMCSADLRERVVSRMARTFAECLSTRRPETLGR